MSNNLRPVFADPHMILLFSHIHGTDNSSLLCAVVLQKISRLIKAEKRRKSIDISIPDLAREHFPYLTKKRVREAVRKMREIGILKIQTSEGAWKTRIWIQDARILELAEQVKRERELGEVAKKLNKEKKVMKAICPYCSKEIESAIHLWWVGDYLTNFDFECPKCGKTMEIDVEMDPVFLTHKKSDTTTPE